MSITCKENSRPVCSSISAPPDTRRPEGYSTLTKFQKGMMPPYEYLSAPWTPDYHAPPPPMPPPPLYQISNQVCQGPCMHAWSRQHSLIKIPYIECYSLPYPLLIVEQHKHMVGFFWGGGRRKGELNKTLWNVKWQEAAEFLCICISTNQFL